MLFLLTIMLQLEMREQQYIIVVVDTVYKTL